MRGGHGAFAVAAAMLTIATGGARAQPPAVDPLIQVSGRSAVSGCTADHPQYQSGQYYPGSEVEPRLAVDPRDSRHLVGTFQQDRWSTGGARGLVTRTSFDGGINWKETIVPGVSRCSDGPYDRASDPWVSFAPDGTVFHSALAFSQDLTAILVNRSTDGGLSWEPPIVLVEERGSMLHDKESITADWTDPASRHVFAVWDRWSSSSGINRAPALFTRTVDGGFTWEPSRVIYDPGNLNTTVGHQIVALPNGDLIDLFTEWRSLGGGYFDALMALMFSRDKGVTWQGPNGEPLRPIRLDLGIVSIPGTSTEVRTAGSLMDVAVDARTGQLWVVWQDKRFTYASAIALSTSTDGGNNWSEPIRVSRTPTSIPWESQQAFTPSVSVGSDGTVAITYYDFRFDDPIAPGGATDHWVVRCRPSRSVPCNRESDWAAEARLTDVSFDMEQAPESTGLFVGDYEGFGTANGDFLAFFSQPHPGDSSSVFFRRIRP